MFIGVLTKSIVVAGLAFTAGGALPPTTPPADTVTEQPEVVDLGFDRTTRMTVPVQIDGNGPYPFVVDTGAERTVISRELALQLGLDSGGSARIHSMTEESSVETVIIPTLAFGAGSINDIRAPALARANMGAPGMLGIDSLKTQRVLMDFKSKTMTITPSNMREERWDSDTIVVTARSRYGQLILVDATAEGQKIHVILDTGSQVSIGNEALRRRLLGKNPKNRPEPLELISVTGGRMMADYTIIKKIRVGGVMLTEMPVAFADVHPFKKLGLVDRPALLLGMDALKVFDRVSVDFAKKRVRFLMPEGGSAEDRAQYARLSVTKARS